MKLEIGGPPHPLEGYEQLDPKVRWEEGTPYEDDTFDEVYAAHVIEHVPWWQSLDALKEAYRILKPGGKLEIHTVDFDYLVKHYHQGTVGDTWNARGNNEEMHPLRWVASRIFSVGPDDNWHKAIFNQEYLEELLTEAGFKDFFYPEKPKGPNHGPMNLGIRAVK